MARQPSGLAGALLERNIVGWLLEGVEERPKPRTGHWNGGEDARRNGENRGHVMGATTKCKCR
jgi:hypothetical protein